MIFNRLDSVTGVNSEKLKGNEQFEFSRVNVLGKFSLRRAIFPEKIVDNISTPYPFCNIIGTKQKGGIFPPLVDNISTPYPFCNIIGTKQKGGSRYNERSIMGGKVSKNLSTSLARLT